MEIKIKEKKRKRTNKKTLRINCNFIKSANDENNKTQNPTLLSKSNNFNSLNLFSAQGWKQFKSCRSEFGRVDNWPRWSKHRAAPSARGTKAWQPGLMLPRGTPVKLDPLPTPRQSTKGSTAVKYLLSRNDEALLFSPSIPLCWHRRDGAKEGKTNKAAVQFNSSASTGLTSTGGEGDCSGWGRAFIYLYNYIF